MFNSCFFNALASRISFQMPYVATDIIIILNTNIKYRHPVGFIRTGLPKSLPEISCFSAICYNHFHGCRICRNPYAVRLSANVWPQRGHTTNGAITALVFLNMACHMNNPSTHTAITNPHAT